MYPVENNQPPPERARRRAADGKLHSSTRERLLREVESRGAASTADLVAATGLHENTVRGHLDRLLADGHVRRERAQPAGRGRPALRWCTVDPEIANPYAGLAATLADTLVRTGRDAPRLARESGTAWGTRLATDRTDHAQVPDAQGLVVEVMREQGFAPDDTDETIVLHRCPLLAAATQRPDIVCAVHEGMIEGIARSRSEDARAEIEPFAPGGVCILRLLDAS